MIRSCGRKSRGPLKTRWPPISLSKTRRLLDCSDRCCILEYSFCVRNWLVVVRLAIACASASPGCLLLRSCRTDSHSLCSSCSLREAGLCDALHVRVLGCRGARSHTNVQHQVGDQLVVLKARGGSFTLPTSNSQHSNYHSQWRVRHGSLQYFLFICR